MTLRVQVDIARQQLSCADNGRLVARYPVSTAANGPGQKMDSLCTPLGGHVICARIGAGLPVNTVFVGRKPTGEIYTPALRDDDPGRDWILTRILWLSGLETNRNRCGEVDTRQRYIYIHGAPDEVPMGQPGSHGCVRMHNQDVIELFDRVAVGTRVDIVDGA
ncbi:MAG: L,D-transpeptidase [Gammaproteobacteria bacterium]|nr:L,D-transpeptidase [Gammaproteobacteria bacterium]NND61459.1 L,D-transpeptidase [Gammaproteobacteria bacterium]